MSESVVVPACPGCHFACPLDAYKCGRGKGFSKLWREGRPVPERGVSPMLRAGKGGLVGNVLPVGARVMHGLNIMANVLQDRHTEAAERKVLMFVARQGGFFALDMLPKRALIDADAMADAVDLLVEADLVTRGCEEVAGEILRITDAGKAQQAVWSAEREQATAEFLSPLSEDEQAQLVDMLFRLIHSVHRDEARLRS